MPIHLCILVGIGYAFEDDDLRCVNSILKVGATPADLLLKCGKPILVENAGIEAEKDGQTVKAAYVKKWYYNLGKGKFVRILTFKGGVPKRIEMGDRQ